MIIVSVLAKPVQIKLNVYRVRLDIGMVLIAQLFANLDILAITQQKIVNFVILIVLLVQTHLLIAHRVHQLCIYTTNNA